MSKLVKTKNYNDIKACVTAIKQSENSYMVKNMNSAKRRNLFDVNSYSSYGLSTAGVKLGFPASFVEKFGNKHPETAKKILYDCYNDCFVSMDENKESGNKRRATSLFIRDFSDKHCAVLTDRYAVFDDDQVVDILSQNDYLMNAEEFWYQATPERFHTRFISKNKLNVNGDNSPLSMCVFVDNSMCGSSSFKVRFGIYRWACTNGVIAGLKNFEIVREAHKGTKDYVQIVAKALEEVELYEKMMLEIVQGLIDTNAKIYELDEEQALAYIQKSLNVGKNASEEIYNNFNVIYGGKSKWDFVNSITEYAHKVDVGTRTMLETKAIKIA